MKKILLLSVSLLASAMTVQGLYGAVSKREAAREAAECKKEAKAIAAKADLSKYGGYQLGRTKLAIEQKAFEDCKKRKAVERKKKAAAAPKKPSPGVGTQVEKARPALAAEKPMPGPGLKPAGEMVEKQPGRFEKMVEKGAGEEEKPMPGPGLKPAGEWAFDTWLKRLKPYHRLGSDTLSVDERWARLKPLVAKYSFYPNIGDGYFFIDPMGDLPRQIMSGKRDEVGVPKFTGLKQGGQAEELEEAKKNMPGLYKIHLMPKQKEFMEVFTEVLEALDKDKELGGQIHRFKIRFPVGVSQFGQEIKAGKKVFPLMVLYPASGKENAQEVLNKLYEIFKGREGWNVTPRFNAKVTSLIYVAQGDGDDKKIEKYEKYFEGPNFIYFNPDEIPPLDKTHHLLHPGTGKELTSPQ